MTNRAPASTSRHARSNTRAHARPAQVRPALATPWLALSVAAAALAAAFIIPAGPIAPTTLAGSHNQVRTPSRELLALHTTLRMPAAALFATSSLEDRDAARLRSLLIRAGLDAEAVTAAGVEAPGVGAIVDAARGVMAEQGPALATADESFRENTRSRERLRNRLVAGVATAEDHAALVTADAAASSASQLRAGIINAAVTAANVSVSQPAADSLATIRAAASDLDLPYRVTARSEESTLALRQALANLRAATAVGEDPDPAAAQIVADADATEAAVTARQRLNANLQSVSQAWVEAIAGE